MLLAIRIFGPHAQLAQASELRVPVEQFPVTCGLLRSRVAECEPRLSESLKTARFARNFEFVSDDQCVEAGDEVALIGSVSGG